MLKAVLFDLDGTLLPVDTETFMGEYLKAIGAAVAPVTDPQRFIRALLTGTEAMLTDRNPQLTNFDVFWTDFRPRLKDCIEDLEPVMDRFYAETFPTLRRVVSHNGRARKAVMEALNRGFRIALATNPVFPARAIRERMAWAGVDDLPWNLVTAYEDMHFCKPHPEYYLEIAERLKVRPEECLMVGNDTGEDICAAGVGMRACLVTDYLIDSGGNDFRPEWTGPLEELPGWLKKGLEI